MPEKSVEQRLDDCESIQESHQTELQEHSERLRDLESNANNLQDLAKRIDALEEDLKIVLKYSGELQHAIVQAASGPGLPELKKFRDKYHLRAG